MHFFLSVAQFSEDFARVFTRARGRADASGPFTVHAQWQGDILIVGDVRMKSHGE